MGSLASPRGAVAALVLLCTAPARGLSDGFGSSTPSMSPADIDAVLNAHLTFMPDRVREEASPSSPSSSFSHSPGSWEAVARTLTGLQKLDCGYDAGVDGRITHKELELLNATEAMVEAAAGGDSLAMAGLGHLYLIGDACSPKRNLTWATHWLDGAAAQGQPDALAMLGFLAESRVLSRLYNFTGHEPGAAIGAQAGTSASADATLGRSLYEKSVTSGGSLLASMALGSQYANGFGGVAASCPAAAAHYESAAMAAIASLDKKRQLNVEQGWLESQAEVKTLLHPGKVEHEGVDAASVEYMDYCAHVGDVAGQVGMGHLYHSGSHGVPRDVRAAEHWFRKAAERGDPMGHANLGLMLLRAGNGDAAIGPLRRAAKRNDPSGWAGLGYAYYYGVGLKRDLKLAAKAIAAAAKLGHLDAIYNLGVLALKGEGMPASVAKAYRFWSVAAEFQHPLAQLLVGRMKLRGLGVPKECRTALFFLAHAAGQAPAVTHLLSQGLQSHQANRPQRALMHYTLAAHMGIEQALTNAGFLYRNSMPALQPSRSSAFRTYAAEYLRRAAIVGSIDASVQLANLLSDPSQPALSRDYPLANQLYSEAAQYGSRDALFHLGYNYLKGRGVRRDLGKALALLRDAGFRSRHVRLRGLEGLGFRAAQLLYEARVALVFVALGSFVLATGGKGVPGLGGGGGAQLGEWVDDADDDEFDDFD